MAVCDLPGFTLSSLPLVGNSPPATMFYKKTKLNVLFHAP